MSANLTEAVFTQQLHTMFRVRVESPQPIELELIEVKGWRSQAMEQGGMERFSVFFNGPADSFMPQNVYALEHEQLGTHDIFLVPVARNANGFCYEAVFNYSK